MSQPSLDLRNRDGSRLTFIRPMLGVESWRALTGLDEDELVAEVTSGKVRFAFNLARQGADRQYLRVWNRSIICFLNPELTQPQSLPEVLNYILPHRRHTLRASDLMRSFNVSSQHVLNLIEDKCFAEVSGHADAAHPKASPVLTRASVVNFLTERRIK